MLVHSRPQNALLSEKLSSAHFRGRAKYDSCQGTLLGTWDLLSELTGPGLPAWLPLSLPVLQEHGAAVP